jgi:hypothetical protein
MASYTGAMTLAQYSAIANDPMMTAAAFVLAQHDSLYAALPFVSRMSMTANSARWQELPDTHWVNVNEEPTRVSSSPEPVQARAFMVRNIIGVDRAIQEDINSITDPLSGQVEAWLRGFAYNFNNVFVNNTPTDDSKALYGLRYMLDNPTNFGLTAANKMDADGVVLETANMTAASFNEFLLLIDEMLYRLDSSQGDNVLLVMNDTLMRRLSYGARLFSGQGGFSQAQDQFGRTFMQYKNARLMNAGTKLDQSTPIITNTETDAGADGASTFTSVYGIRYGSDALQGWQYAPLAPQSLGLNETGVLYQVLCQWTGGFVLQSPRSIARLYNIDMS